MDNEQIRCSSCGTALADAINFCPNCGASIVSRCKSCGNVLTETDKFCPNCGAKQNTRNKNQFIKKLIILIILLSLLAMGIIAITRNSSEVHTATPIAVDITEPATEPGDVVKPNLDAFKSFIEATLGSSFDFCATSDDGISLNIGVAIDGFTDTIIKTQDAGYGADFEPWVQVKEAMLEMYDTICDAAKNYELHDTKITLMFLNDTNHANALLIIRDGVVCYDFLTD